MPRILIATLIALLFPAQGMGSDSLPEAKISLHRISDDLWRAEFSFSRAIPAFRVYPPTLAFRQDAWRPLTRGLALEETSGGGVFSAGGQPFEGFVIEFDSDADFTSDTYVPVLPFSDGSAAVYTGHFSGDALLDGNWRSLPTVFELAGRGGESTLLPARASERNPVYAFFGELALREAEQVTMLLDPAMPEWLRDSLEYAVPVATSVFSRRLELDLPDKPMVIVAAGELSDFEGYSVKGGGLGGQFTIMLRGRDLLEHSAGRQRMFEKMVAHELVHVWQAAMPGGGINPEQPWLHEGGAEALAVAALREAGVWTDSVVEAFHHGQREACADSLGDSDLQAAAGRGNWDAIYACGYLEFSQGVDDPFQLWLRLTRAARQHGSPYTQEMLDAVRPVAGRVR